MTGLGCHKKYSRSLSGRQGVRNWKNWKSLTEKTQVLESLFILAALRNTAPLYPEWRLLKFGYLGCGVSWLSFSVWHKKLKLLHIWKKIIKKYWYQGTNVQIRAMKSWLVCLQIRNKNLSMTILRERYLRTELYSQKATQIFFKITLKETELHMKSFRKCLKT